MSSTARVLPPELHPGLDIIRRRHKPEPGTYGDFRECLRWEFGFICAFCLLHEADIIKHGAEGTGMMWPDSCRCRRARSEKKRIARRRIPKMYADQAVAVPVP